GVTVHDYGAHFVVYVELAGDEGFDGLDRGDLFGADLGGEFGCRHEDQFFGLVGGGRGAHRGGHGRRGGGGDGAAAAQEVAAAGIEDELLERMFHWASSDGGLLPATGFALEIAEGGNDHLVTPGLTDYLHTQRQALRGGTNPHHTARPAGGVVF